jgi:hypothetical protein
MAYSSSGTAGKSASGASMSKYDVEVEARLQALEAAVKELKAHEHEVPAVAPASDDVAAQVAEINEKLSRHQIR